MLKVKGQQTDRHKKTKHPLPSLFTRFGHRVQAELAGSIPIDDIQLYTSLRYHLGWVNQDRKPMTTKKRQGKALRPALCLFACQALGGEWQKALPAAAALEFTHNFSLIHDDIQDGDTERRHQPTVWALWGQPKALVAGDLMHSLSYKVALDLTDRGVSNQKALRSSSLLVESSLSMIEGQCLDLAFEGVLDIGLEEYLRMIRLKTGALIACSLEVGALLASNNDSHIEAFARYGSHLGRIFQIRDDMLGIWGNEKDTGKATGNDIRRRKKSFPIVHTMERAGREETKELISIYKKEYLNELDVTRVLSMLDDMGAQKQAEAFIAQESQLALKELDRMPLPSQARNEAEELVEFLVSREY